MLSTPQSDDRAESAGAAKSSVARTRLTAIFWFSFWGYRSQELQPAGESGSEMPALIFLTAGW